MAEQVPSVGRMVHFVCDNQHVPAIIIDPAFEVRRPDDEGGNEITQFLFVFTATRGNFHTNARFDPTGQEPGTWHWSEFVPPKPVETSLLTVADPVDPTRNPTLPIRKPDSFC